jgi:Flp pilus assembly protein TadG
MKRTVSIRNKALVQPGEANRGQSLVEFAMVVPLFFLLIFGMIDIGRAFFVQVTLQNAMRQAGRFAVTGNHLTQGGTNLTRVASIIQIAQQAAVGTDISSIQISSAQGGAGSAGGPSDTVTISLTSNLQLITPMIGQFFGPNGIYTFTVSTTFRNEPFNPSQTT